MISIVGIGNGASAIAEKFKGTSQYNVYVLNDKVKRTSKYKFKLKRFEEPEEYEKNAPDLTKFFAEIDDRVQVFIVGSSYSSNFGRCCRIFGSRDPTLHDFFSCEWENFSRKNMLAAGGIIS